MQRAVEFSKLLCGGFCSLIANVTRLAGVQASACVGSVAMIPVLQAESQQRKGWTPTDAVANILSKSRQLAAARCVQAQGKWRELNRLLQNQEVGFRVVRVFCGCVSLLDLAAHRYTNNQLRLFYKAAASDLGQIGRQ